MRIVQVIASLDPGTGGPAAVAARLAAAQAALGHQVTLVAYRRGQAESRTRQSLSGIPGFERVSQQMLAEPSRVERVLARSARRELAHILAGADIVHVHGVWDAICKAATDVARRMGIGYVVTPHGMLDPWSLSQSRLRKRVALWLGYRRMLNQAAFLHALNEDEARLMTPLELATPVRVIPNGVFMEEVRPLPEAGSFQRAHPELRGLPFVLFLGRLHYKKGLDYLAEAFAQVAERDGRVQLVVAGPDGGAKADFEQRVTAKGLEPRVHLVGPLYGARKLAALVDAACFCLPSRQEGFSVAILEALACRTPVVISEGCHFPEVAAAGAGLVVPLEAEAVASALRQILDDPGARERMGQCGEELVRRRFTWPVIAEQAIEAYAVVR